MGQIKLAILFTTTLFFAAVASAEATDKITAHITISENSDFAPQLVLMSAAGSSMLPGATRYEWTFGDGERGEGFTVEHFFVKAGTYTITLTIVGANGSATATQTLVLKRANRPSLPLRPSRLPRHFPI